MENYIHQFAVNENFKMLKNTEFNITKSLTSASFKSKTCQ